MRTLIKKEEADRLINGKLLLPVKWEKTEIFATDMEYAFVLVKEETPDSVYILSWKYTLYKISGRDEMFPDIPRWVKKEDYMDAIQSHLRPTTTGDGSCYTMAQGSMRHAGCWYANNATEAIRCCLCEFTAVEDVCVTEGTLLYDNGEAGRMNKGIQIWRVRHTLRITFYDSIGDKKVNYDHYSDNAMELLKYATQNKNSEWLKGYKWMDLLNHELPIGPFEEVEETTIRQGNAHYYEEIKAAVSGEYLLVKVIWGWQNGEDGDKDLYLFEYDSLRKDLSWKSQIADRVRCKNI